jgi:hypothetical protein
MRLRDSETERELRAPNSWGWFHISTETNMVLGAKLQLSKQMWI